MLRLTCIVAIATVAVALVDLAVAEGRSRSFEMLPYSDVTFDENLMFDLAVRSKLDCAKECTGHDGCVVYTFTEVSAVQGTCRGHSSPMDVYSPSTHTSMTSAYHDPGVDLSALDLTANCSASYTVLDEAWRDSSVANSGGGNHCDSGLAAGWYRFILNGSDAVIPTTCVDKWHCGGDVTMTLNLGQASLPGVGQDLVTETCGGWTSTCCGSDFGSQNAITVRNCGTFYIYNLVPPGGCQTVYCIEPL